MLRIFETQLVGNFSGRLRCIEISENTVRDFETTAILVGKGIFKINMNNQDMTYKMAFMEVYLKKNNVWKLISRQSTTY